MKKGIINCILLGMSIGAAIFYRQAWGFERSKTEYFKKKSQELDDEVFDLQIELTSRGL